MGVICRFESALNLGAHSDGQAQTPCLIAVLPSLIRPLQVVSLLIRALQGVSRLIRALQVVSLFIKPLQLVSLCIKPWHAMQLDAQQPSGSACRSPSVAKCKAMAVR